MTTKLFTERPEKGWQRKRRSMNEKLAKRKSLSHRHHHVDTLLAVEQEVEVAVEAGMIVIGTVIETAEEEEQEDGMSAAGATVMRTWIPKDVIREAAPE